MFKGDRNYMDDYMNIFWSKVDSEFSKIKEISISIKITGILVEQVIFKSRLN